MNDEPLQTPATETTEAPPGIVTALAVLPPASHLDAAALANILGRCKKSVERAVRRGELPAPFRFLGKSMWTVSAILAHLQERQKVALELAAKRERRLLERMP